MLSIDSGNQFHHMHNSSHYSSSSSSSTQQQQMYLQQQQQQQQFSRGVRQQTVSSSTSSSAPRAPLPIVMAPKPTPSATTSQSSSSQSTSVNITAPNSSNKDWASMEREVRAGAAWWRAKARAGVPSLTPVQLDVFEKALVRALAGRFEGHWYADEPQRGSAFRAIVTDGSIDVSVAHAATVAKIALDDRFIPSFTTMWINPGRVTVRVAKSMWDEDADVFQVFPESSPRRNSATASE